MRKLFHTAAAIAALLALSIAANAAEVGAGNFVLGIEGDFDGVANTNTAANGVVGPGIGTILLTSNNRWITTLAASPATPTSNISRSME